VRIVRPPSTGRLIDSASNAWNLLPLVGAGVADLTPLPSTVVDEGPQRTVRRFRMRTRRRHESPILLVPPLAAPPSCFDLHRGCSLAEHLTGLGYRTYVVDYGPIGFGDRALGLEHWVEDVLPAALRAVSQDTGGAPVQPLGWCLGGIMLLLAVARDRQLPVASVSLVASPFDFARLRAFAPVRRLAGLTGGALGTALYRMLGGAPAPLVSLGFRLTALDRYIGRPLFLAGNLHDRDRLAQMEAVDAYMAGMLAYPGRTFGQLYHAFFRVNDLADGRVELGDGGEIDLRDVRVPVLSIAGASDVLAPLAAVHHVGGLLEGSPDVQLATMPGGHLGVLTGLGARHTTWPRVDEFLAGAGA
jgi:polyhydroxyalkanoate synthase subunit PhaC